MNEPGGSLPMIVRVSTPSPRSASACSSACSLTAPQKDHENGTTMPTFTALSLFRCPAWPPRPCGAAARAQTRSSAVSLGLESPDQIGDVGDLLEGMAEPK